MVKLGKKKLAEELSKRKSDRGSEEKNSKNGACGNGDDGAEINLEKEKDNDSKYGRDSLTLKRSGENRNKRKAASSANRRDTASKSDSDKEQDRHREEEDTDSDDVPLNGNKGSNSVESSRDPPPSKKSRKQAKPKATTSKGTTAGAGKTAANNGNNKKEKKKNSQEIESDDEELDEDERNDDEDKDEKSEEEKEFEVEAIMGHRITKGVSHFLVRWKGYGKNSDSWEPEADLNCDDLIDDFRQKNKGAGKGSPKKDPKKSTPISGTPGSASGSGRGRGRSSLNANAKAIKKQSADPEKEWAVERIVDFAEDDEQGPLYRIRWKGFGAKEDTWEPESNLSCEGLIEKYKKSLIDQRNVDAKQLRESPKKTKRLVNETIPRSNLHNRIERSSKRSSAKNRVFYGEE